MQTVSRYLLNNTIIVYQTGYQGRNSKVYDRRLKVYRGVSNPLNFTFKNEDQKSQDVTARTFEFNIIDNETNSSVVTKNLTILDDGSTFSTKGTTSVTILEGDLLALDAKFYTYSIREVVDDVRTITFADTAYNAEGTIEISDGAYPQFVPSDVIDTFTKAGSTYTSSYKTANPGVNNNTALHTVAVYPKNFAGTLTIEGTMATSAEVTADPQHQYFTISTNNITTSDTVNYYNFNGVLQGVRFVWTNSVGNSGSIDKILYRS
jgi:hypothetical protein